MSVIFTILPREGGAMAIYRIIILIALLGIFLFLGGFIGCDCEEDDDDDDKGDKGGDDDSSDDDDSTDDDDDSTGETCFIDGDNDGYGDPDVSNVFPEGCPDGWVSDSSDCDDEHAEAHPGGYDLPDDGIDGDCVGGDFVASDENGVFVSATGLDTNPGTMFEPKQTLQAGVDLATTVSKSVFVAGASYVNSVSTDVSLYGGYNTTFTQRDPDTYVTMVTGPSKTSLSVASGANVIINGFTINGGLDDNSSHALWIGGSATVIKNTVIGASTATFTHAVRIHDVTTLARLIDNTITGGSGSDESSGVSVLLEATAILENNRIDGGEGGNQSYGIIVHDATSTLSENEISGGTSGASWGVAIDDATVTMTKNTVHGGTGEHPTGVSINKGAVTLLENTINGGTMSKGSESKLPETMGISVNDGNITITRNTINGGTSHLTKGVNVSDGQVTMDSNTINGGTCDGEGYGVYSQGTATLVNNLITTNGCTGLCVAVFINDGTGTIINNTLIGSASGVNSLGLDIDESTVAAVNNIIDPGNGTTSSIGVRTMLSPTSVSLANNDIWGQGITILLQDDMIALTDINDVNDCTNWPSNCAETSGNINENPEYADAANDDYHLSGDACVDTGSDPAAWYSGTSADTDFEGDPRPTGAGWDIGMDEKL